ncbi:hypothetical protein ACFSUJ_07700 [Streptomyces lusitanus]|uniref:Uncharacterized protein n=2 Tax=Streptomyces lusitanus TaxID=68232 RepID=A0ABU3JYI7_9ACTN|nr:hypothetical protein [Streptomyces lusitanus]
MRRANGPRQLTELTDVYDFLDEVRLRPGMWLPRSSLKHLESLLTGYRAAMVVHGVEGEFDFWSPGTQGPFTEWLWHRLGRESPLSWATEIEREAEATGVPAIELLFRLFDEYRADRDRAS